MTPILRALQIVRQSCTPGGPRAGEKERERRSFALALSESARESAMAGRAGGGNMELDIHPRVRTQDPSRFKRFGNFCPINEFN